MIEHASERLIQFLQVEEGFRSRPYNDSRGHATQGFGHLLHLGPVDPTRDTEVWSRDHALEVLRRDVERHVEELIAQVPAVQHLEQHQFDAITSWVFNLGMLKVRDSTLLRELAAGGLDVVPVELMRWHSPGSPDSLALTNRRRREAYMWVRGQYEGVK